MGTSVATETTREADTALARSALYRVLAEAFEYPTRQAMARLRQRDLPLARAASSPLGLERAVARVADALRGRSYRRIEAAYRDLFSQVASVDCPPHETDYTTTDIFRKSEEMADVAGFYRAFGVEGSAEERARPDHVTVELEFMHLLTYKEAWARAHEEADGLEVCLEAQRAFLRDHLARWFPDFARRVAALGSGTPYEPVAALAGDFFRAEMQRFGIQPGLTGPAAARGKPDPEPPGLCEEGA